MGWGVFFVNEEVRVATLPPPWSARPRQGLRPGKPASGVVGTRPLFHLRCWRIANSVSVRPPFSSQTVSGPAAAVAPRVIAPQAGCLRFHSTKRPSSGAEPNAVVPASEAVEATERWRTPRSVAVVGVFQKGAGRAGVGGERIPHRWGVVASLRRC